MRDVFFSSGAVTVFSLSKKLVEGTQYSCYSGPDLPIHRSGARAALEEAGGYGSNCHNDVFQRGVSHHGLGLHRVAYP